ncbi:MAG TPA: hypothetical protein VH062_00560 [Polyangiaceae bacterium]|jgi:hypothetical protein|nr:hypothetical protein [Polyangiaceae bacterium]
MRSSIIAKKRNHRRGARWIAPSCASLALLAGCSGSGGEAGKPTDTRESEHLVDPSRQAVPPRGADLPATPVIPGLTDAFLQGMLQPGSALNVQPDSDIQNWRSRVTDPGLTPSSLGPALDAAIATMSAYPGLELGDTQLTIRGLGVPTGNSVVVAYEPERARWMPDTTTPPAVEEIRERGARLYCSAREAYLQGGGRSQLMGKKSLAHFSVLGKRIDLFKIEPTVAMRAPLRFAGNGNDGAQAFAIPMAVGARFTPITPISLPEMRTNVDFVTADAAVLNQMQDQGVDMETVTHADAFRAAKVDSDSDLDNGTEPSQGSGDTGSNPIDIPLFSLGPVDFDLGFGFEAHTVVCSHADSFGSCDDDAQQFVPRLLDVGQPGWPAPRSGGATGGMFPIMYNDAPWGFDANGVPTLEGNGGTFPLQSPDPMWMRMFQDNDKSLEVRSGLTVKADLNATLGVKAQDLPFQLDITATGEVAATVALAHAIREQLEAVGTAGNDEFGYSAQTALSVTPHAELELGFALQVQIAFKLHLPIVGEIAIKITPLNKTIASTFHSFPAWSESERLRIATARNADGGDLSQELLSTQIDSHWPAQNPFPAQSLSLSDCLNEASPPGASATGQDLEKPCGSVPPSDADAAQVAPPHGQLCFVTPDVILDADHCQGALWGFAHNDNLGNQNFNGQDSLVRIVPLDPGDPTMMSTWQELEQAVGQCDNGDAGAIQSLLEQHLFVCDPDGHPLTPDQAVSADSDESDGVTELPVDSCH